MRREFNILLMFGPCHGLKMNASAPEAMSIADAIGITFGNPMRVGGQKPIYSCDNPWYSEMMGSFAAAQKPPEPPNEVLAVEPGKPANDIWSGDGDRMRPFSQKARVHRYFRMENFTSDLCEDVWIYTHDDRCCEQGMP